MPSGKSTAGSDPGVPPPPVLTGRDAGAAAVVAGAAYLTAKFTAPTVPEHAAVFFAAAVLHIVAGRLADRLWDSTMAPVLPASDAWGPSGRRGIAARFPFRLLGGGITFTAALLAAKRAGIIPLRDVPVIEIFATGALLSAAYYGIDEGWKALRRGRLREAPRDGTPTTTEGGNG